MEIQYDTAFNIAVGKSRHETTWKNKNVTWSQFLQKIENTTRTAETVAEYHTMKKAAQAERKDVGGYVGGYIEGGRRKNESVLFRQLVTLDLDFATSDVWDDFTDIFSNAMAMYSTHSHIPEKPRYRLIIPLDREVTPTEYEALSRRLASYVGIDLFDDSTFQPARLMYWPSTPKDGEYYFRYTDGPVLAADEILSTYKHFNDSSEWPISSRVKEVVLHEAKKQGDPESKPGIVGAFCRAYSIRGAITKFLADIYTQTAIDGRYTYEKGSTAAGLVVYDDKFAYSHHGTDPAGGILCNAFDLVRIHLFGLKDEDCKVDTPINRKPSYIAMSEFCMKDKEVAKLMAKDRIRSAGEDFSEVTEEENDDWLAELDTSKDGKKIFSTTANIVKILENDPKLKGKIKYDEFNLCDVISGDLPWRRQDSRYDCFWRNEDDACLRVYLETVYGISGKDKIADAKRQVLRNNCVHPIRSYLSGLSWDGVKRLDSLFIDYLGAEDIPLVRAMTRKQMTAAVARIFSPGCKYDYTLVLIGEEGTGKSSIFSKLGKQWFSDSFSGVEGKNGMEQLRRKWIIEIGELAGLKKSEVETIKAFLSKQVDVYRPSFSPVTESIPRQCVFFATTNEENFLRGDNGNRRFWPIHTGLVKPVKNVFRDLTDKEIDQIWAEAVIAYREGEELYLPKELEREVRKKQSEVNELEADPRIGMVQAYLDTLLPVDWDTRSMAERRAWIRNTDPLCIDGSVRRDKVCIAEILNECFGVYLRECAPGFRSREIVAIMKRIEGWEPISTGRFGPYGRQRGYKRIDTNDGAKTATDDEIL